MRHLLPPLLTAALAVATPGLAAAQQLDGFTECGTINGYTQATATKDGAITIGSRSFILKADQLYSDVGQNRSVLAIGRAICLQGTLDAPGRFVQYVGIPIPDPYCGTVVAYRPATGDAGSVSLREIGVATFAIPPATEAGTITFGSRICLGLRLDTNGDAVVRSRTQTLAERAAASLNVCGLVSRWTAPERVDARALLVHRTAGSITVGTRNLPIAAGTEYSLVNVPPQVGQATCLSGWLNVDGQLISYAAQPGMYRPCGRLAEFVAPTATGDGLLRIAVTASAIPPTAESYRFRVPAGTALPADAGNGTYCFTLGLDARGDAVIAGVPPVVRVSSCGTVTDAFLGDLPAGGSVTIDGKRFLIGGADSRMILPPIDRVRVGARACVRGQGEPVDSDIVRVSAGELTLDTEPRHSSGLVVLRGAVQPPGSPPSEPLAKANSDAWQMAEASPDDLGYSWSDRAAGELVIFVASIQGETLVRRWIDAGARIATAKGDLVLGPPQVPVRVRTGGHSWGELERIKHDVTLLRQAGVPDADAIWGSAPDGEHDRVIVTVDRASDRLFEALASRYGTDAVAVRVERDPHFVSLAGGTTWSDGRDADRPLIAAATAAVGVALAAVAGLIIRRRRPR